MGKRGNMESTLWTAKELIKALKRFPSETKVYYEMGPNGPGTIGKAQYVKAWGGEGLDGSAAGPIGCPTQICHYRTGSLLSDSPATASISF